jgi:hypothetical protein
VDVVITSLLKGKPPHETLVADLRVRNPLAVPVWLLFDVGDAFPAMVTSVIPWRTTPGRGAHIWLFSGDDSFEAVRIPGEARLVLRDAELSSFDRERPLALVFATRITVGEKPAEEWLGRSGLLPTSRDFHLASLDTEHAWHGDPLNAPAVHVDVLFVSRVNLPALITPTP